MSRGTHGKHARGRRTGRWTSEKMIGSQGYVKLRVGRAHPLADPNGYCYEHKIVLAAAGIEVPDGFVIHHANGDRTDNRIENLCVIARGHHNTHHNKEKGRNERGQFVGKKKAGRILDGREWNEMPLVAFSEGDQISHQKDTCVARMPGNADGVSTNG